MARFLSADGKVDEEEIVKQFCQGWSHYSISTQLRNDWEEHGNFQESISDENAYWLVDCILRKKIVDCLIRKVPGGRSTEKISKLKV